MPLDLNDPETKAAVDKLVSTAVTAAVGDVDGLKDNTNKLLAEKKELQSKLKNFDGLDIESVKSLQQQLQSSEETKLIAEGKVDEVLNMRFEKMRVDYDGKVSDLTAQLEQTEQAAHSYKSRFEKSKIETALRTAAEKAQVVPEAIDDVVLRGSSVFCVDDDGAVVSRDADGKLITNEAGARFSPDLFVEDLKPRAPHYWRSSTSGGFGGDDGAGGAGDSLTKKIMAAADSGDMSEYQRLRKIQKNKKKNEE